MMYQLFAAAVAVIGTLFLSNIIYNLFFHQLRRFPGPWYFGASDVLFSFYIFRGNLSQKVLSLHEKYGHVVRVAPNELSYNNAEAWKEIYGRNSRATKSRKAAQVLFPKDPHFYGPSLGASDTILDAPDGSHRQQKRSLASEFTSKMLLAKEQIRLSSLNHLIETWNKLLDNPEGQITVDLVPWIVNSMLDMAGKLAIGHDFKAIERGENAHPIAKSGKNAVYAMMYYHSFRRMSRYLNSFIDAIPSLFALETQSLFQQMNLLRPAILERLKKGEGLKELSDTTDLVDCLLRETHNEKQDVDQLVKNITIFIIAPGETLGTYIINTIYWIACETAVYERLTREIRLRYAALEEMTASSTSSFKYLDACMRESSRIQTPFRDALPRVVAEGGATICDQYVPQGTIVGVHMWSSSRSSKNFHNADQFVPERWLDNTGVYSNDDQEAPHPWSYGPRVCIAKEYSITTARVYLARLLWEFDLRLDASSKHWAANLKGTYLLAKTAPLYIEVARRAK